MEQPIKVFVLFAAAAGCLWLAQASPAGDDRQAGADQKFVTEAASGGIKEVKLGQMASEQAAATEVKQFGKHMVEDHTKANKELAALLGKKGISPPKEMTDKHRAAVEKLSKLKGAEFDREYTKHMVDSHKEAIALFEAQAKEGQDADLKAFASKTLPTLKHHLDMAQKLAEKGR